MAWNESNLKRLFDAIDSLVSHSATSENFRADGKDFLGSFIRKS